MYLRNTISLVGGWNMAAAALALVACGAYLATAPPTVARADTHGTDEVVILDVLSDARTIVINHRDPAQATSDPFDAEDFGRGDTFILEGVIYPGGTLPPGPDQRLPEDFSGAIGRWVCRGVLNVSATQAFAEGLSPHTYSTEFFFLNDGRTYITEGPEGGGTYLRAVVGGTGPAAGVSGQQMSAEIGANGSGLQNFRMELVLEQPGTQLTGIETALDANTGVLAAVQTLLSRVARTLSLKP